MPDNVPAVIDTDAFLGFVERAMRDPSFDVAKFQVLLDLYHIERDRVKRDAFNQAMALVQSEITQVRATGRNPTFNNPYARLEDLDRDARHIYSAHGFNVRYGSALSDKSVPAPSPGEIRIVLTISHSAGYSEEHHLDGPKDTQTGARGRTGIQAVGSTVTYLRRYLLQMVLNLVQAGNPDDDDGEATRRSPPPPRPQQGGNGGAEERLANLQKLLDECPNTDAIEALHKRSLRVIETAPPAIKQRIVAMFDKAMQNVALMHDPELAELVAEVDQMSLDEIENLSINGEWIKRVSMIFPPDQDTLAGHVTMRKAQLKGQTNG